VETLGSAVMRSPAFARAFSQAHHNIDNVGRHSLSTARMCVVINRALHMGADERVLVEAALLHDLGLVGRDKKYGGERRTVSHPDESRRIARDEFVSDSAVLDAVSAHMWPLYGKMPRSKEAWIVNIADDVVSVIDWPVVFVVWIAEKVRRVKMTRGKVA